MNALGNLISEAGCALTGGLWKVGSIVLAILLIIISAGLGFEWWLAAHDRDVARTALAKEQGVSAALRASIAIQNSAVDAMQAATAQADARGLAAQQMAASAGRRYDAALAKLGTARAITCADAMPSVNQLLESVR